MDLTGLIKTASVNLPHAGKGKKSWCQVITGTVSHSENNYSANRAVLTRLWLTVCVGVIFLQQHKLLLFIAGINSNT